MSALLSGFHFLRPHWLWALALLPVVLWSWRQRHRAASAWRALIDPQLQPHVLEANAMRGGARGVWLLLPGLALAVLALAGPAWRQQPVTLWQPQAPLVVCLDLSSAMLAADLSPSRLARARYKLADLLARRRGGQVALIAYAGDAFTVAPLTADSSNVAAFLEALAPDVMPVDGQRADRAIARASELIRQAGFPDGDILLLTDRTDAAARAAASRAHRAGDRVFALGIGTTQGAPVSGARGFLTDADGRVRMPRLDADALRELAAAGGGRYAVLAPDVSDLESLGLLDPAAARAGRSDETGTQWRDDGYWLLLVLLPLALFGFRRGWLALCLVLAWPMPDAQALDWHALWRRDDQRAHAALQAGDAETARALARDPLLAAAAAYRAGDFADADELWARSDSADAHYNRGNALARAGRYQDALAAYDQALHAQPAMADAQANRDAVEDWLKRQPPPSSSQQGGQQQNPSQTESGQTAPQASEQGEGEQEPKTGEQQRNDTDAREGDADRASSDAESGAPEPPPEDAAQRQQAADEAARRAMEAALREADDPAGEPAAAEAEPSRAEREQRQAAEAWLRRVPDDPGGLLRRKFALEYERRRAEGSDR